MICNVYHRKPSLISSLISFEKPIFLRNRRLTRLLSVVQKTDHILGELYYVNKIYLDFMRID